MIGTLTGIAGMTDSVNTVLRNTGITDSDGGLGGVGSILQGVMGGKQGEKSSARSYAILEGGDFNFSTGGGGVTQWVIIALLVYLAWRWT